MKWKDYKQVFGFVVYMALVCMGIYRICMGQGLSAIVDLGFAGGIYLWLNDSRSSDKKK